MSAFFLIASTLFPRLTLLVSYFFFSLPVNETPFWIDLIAFFICPRLLIAYWGYNIQISFFWILALVGMEIWEKTKSKPAQSEEQNIEDES